jgi:hypothetical protein
LVLDRSKDFFLSTAYRPALGLVELPILRIRWAFSQEIKRSGSKSDYYGVVFEAQFEFVL